MGKPTRRKPCVRIMIGLFEDSGWQAFLPLTRTRPIWALWWGFDTLLAKWTRYHGWPVVGLCPAQAILFELYPPKIPSEKLLWLNARLLPHTPNLTRILQELPENTFYEENGTVLALKADLSRGLPPTWEANALEGRYRALPWPKESPPHLLSRITDLFQHTRTLLEADWAHLKTPSEPLPSTPFVRGKDNIYLASGAKVDWAFLDATDGPLYIGAGAHIQDGAIVGSYNAIGPHSIITAGTRLRTHNSIGPTCKVGGEIGQSTILGFSNKAHEGFLGHSVLGEWCNLGAGSNTSNLKNTYGPVQLYDIASGQLQNTGLQFCGLIMGDYARCGIQTPFTTGCLVDIGANIVSTTFTPKYVPPFQWSPGTVWELSRFLTVIERIKARRNLPLTTAEKNLIQTLYSALTPPSQPPQTS